MIGDPAVLRSLNRIANTAYPGFRPEASGGETRPPSCASNRRRQNASAGGRGGARSPLRKADEQGRVLPALAFNVIKPYSPESRLISELATEVAYLVGSRANKRTSPRTTSSSSSREPTAAAKQQERERWSTAEEITEAAERSAHVNRGAGASLALVSPRNHAAGTKSGDLDVRVGGDQDKVVSPITPTRGNGVGIKEGVVSGRPGTYLGCGITSCKGLGFSGEHGDAAGNVSHAAFVRREVESGGGGGGAGGGGGGGVESLAGDDEVRDTRGGASLGSDGPGKKAGDATNGQGAAGKSPTAPPDVVVATPLALLSAREPGFRDELIRRKDHYGLGGMRKGDARVGDEKEGVASLEIPAIVKQDAEKMRRGAPAAVYVGRSVEAPWRARSSRKLGRSSPLPVDIAESPLMASTRPAAVNPASGSGRIDPACQDEGVSKSCRSRCVATSGDKEFVKFARPAAHWSVANGLSASPGRARGKSVRVPKGVSDGVGGSVVGRFACRGYLLDPTFTDSNPIILHPRLPQIDGGGGGFSQVPEGSTLAELVASPAVKDGKNGGARAGGKAEPYRNVVEVLRHDVVVSGGRKAAKSFHEMI